MLKRILDDVMKSAQPVITANELDTLLASVTARLSYVHPAYEKVAGRMAMGALYKETPSTFSESIKLSFKDHSAHFTTMYRQAVNALAPFLDAEIVADRDFDLTYDVVLLFKDVYLMRRAGRLLERPQHLFLRISVAINGPNLNGVRKTYGHLSKGLYIHEPSAMIYAGTTLGQMIPRYSLPFDGKTSMDRFMKLTECSMISYAGGSVSLSVSDYPAEGELVEGRPSTGVPAITRVFDSVIHRIGNGGDLTRGKITMYMEPWHSEIFHFLQSNTKVFAERLAQTRGLFFALWIPDLFLRRVEQGGNWSLFRPGDVPLLTSTLGNEFDEAYQMYEHRRLAVRSIPAKDLWDVILNGIMETGAKSNLAHIGRLRHGGPAADTALFSSSCETGISATASIVLPAFVSVDGTFNYQLLHRIAKSVTRDLNRVLLLNNYPSMPTAASYVLHRSIGIGIIGLADTFIALRLPYESDEALQVGRHIMETIYHGSLDMSCDLVDLYGAYPTFPGSPLSKGYFQFDLWNVEVSNDRYDWNALRMRIMHRGVANAHVVLLTDTASSSRLTSYTEGFDPLLSPVLLKGFACTAYVSLHVGLINELQKLGLWDDAMRQDLLGSCGSVQTIDRIPTVVKTLFKTAWEVKQNAIVRHAVARAPFVCQSQSIMMYRDGPSRHWLVCHLLYYHPSVSFACLS
ncbi:hypothetical protein CVT26_013945 [Gymnopilus dilepis]|uniref:Ribonucleoside-diphosphate reductase n=1 Tax=Gymnopilus dilepis TaxID=231916 RepID=A0A409WDP8_9AGAR|nr:hypothetical protein CVT26_013945 [Gymnopilus dilepis]